MSGSGITKKRNCPLPDLSFLDKYIVPDPYINPQGKLRRLLLANAEKRASLIAHTEGFYLGKWKNHQYEVPENGIHSRSVDDDTVISAAVCAMNYWSEKQGRIVRLEKIERVNAQGMMGTMFYLTLKGTDNQFYEAKVFKDFRGNFESRMVRRALYYPCIEAWVLDSFDAPDDSCDDHDAPDDDDEFCDHDDDDVDDDDDDDAFH